MKINVHVQSCNYLLGMYAIIHNSYLQLEVCRVCFDFLRT